MRGVVIVLGVAAGALATPSGAADDFIKGVYLQTEELCAQARKDGLQAVLDEGNLYVHAGGIDGVEYTCEFLDVKKAKLAPGWVVTALCQEPGYAQPDVLSVLELSPTQLDLVSVKPVLPDQPAGNTGSYVLCDGVSPP